MKLRHIDIKDDLIHACDMVYKQRIKGGVCIASGKSILCIRRRCFTITIHVIICANVIYRPIAVG